MKVRRVVESMGGRVKKGGKMSSMEARTGSSENGCRARRGSISLRKQ
jgi:hypothetical protein